MKDLDLQTQLTGGRINPVQSERIRKWLEEVGDGFVYITISKTKKPKTHGQLGYYWGVILPTIGNFMGEDPPVVHKLMKDMFLTIEHEEFGKVTLSTSSLTSKQTASYYDQIIRYWKLTHGVIIPPPNTVDEVPMDIA